MQRDVSISLQVLQIGLISTSLIFIQSPILSSDGFVVGKAFLLALGGLIGLCVFLVESRNLSTDPSDLALVALMGLVGTSALTALNEWNATTAATGSVATIALFWTSRSISLSPHRAALLLAGVGALGLVLISALAEAYAGLQLSVRPPGGTIGNRNRMAHLLVFGLPSLALLITRVRLRWMLGLMLLGSTMSATAILLSRSRAAWIATLVVVGVGGALILLRSQSVTAGGSYFLRRTPRRLAFFFAAAGFGILIGLVFPNDLKWVSSTPYRDSAAALVEYQSGTGAGRLTEYRNTLRMIGDHPVLGVGSGNWRIAYPIYATPGDPNIALEFAPVRRFPQGEWIGGAAERGIPSLLVLFTFGGILAWRWLRAVISERSHRRVGYAFVGLLTMVAVFMVGLFDPVIMTPTAGFVVPVLLGVCAAPFANLRVWTPSTPLRIVLVSVFFVGGLLLVSFPAREVWAAMTYAKRPTVDAFERATKIAPGDYRAHYFAAGMLVQRGDCARAAPYIETARRLYPTAPAAVGLEEQCASIVSGMSTLGNDGSPTSSSDAVER